MEKELVKFLGITFGIVTIVLIAVAFFVDLGTVKFTFSGVTVYTTNTTFFGTIHNGQFSSWGNYTKGMTGSTLNKANSGIDMIYASMATIIIAAIFAVIGIVTVFGKSSEIMKNMSFIAPIVSAILIIVTIVLYYEGAKTLLNAYTTLLNTYTSASPFKSVLTTTVSLAIGAYLVIVAVITEFLAAGFNILSGSKK